MKTIDATVRDALTRTARALHCVDNPLGTLFEDLAAKDRLDYVYAALMTAATIICAHDARSLDILQEAVQRKQPGKQP